MSTHTPGPWVLDGHTIFGAPDPRSRHKNGRPAIAQVVPMSAALTPGFDDGRYQEADARLIAAAPSLLAEIEEALEAYELDPELQHRFRAVVDRAKGGPSHALLAI